jgi:hypothetical protein
LDLLASPILLKHGHMWPSDSSIGQRIVGEYLANRFAGEILTETGLLAPLAAYDAAEASWVVGLAKHARRMACRLLVGDGEPRDLERARESVRLLAHTMSGSRSGTTASTRIRGRTRHEGNVASAVIPLDAPAARGMGLAPLTYDRGHEGQAHA